MTAPYGGTVLEVVQKATLDAKALVAWPFRNGPIEDLHAVAPCIICSGNPEISQISDEEMKAIKKQAVSMLYRLLRQRGCDPAA